MTQSTGEARQSKQVADAIAPASPPPEIPSTALSQQLAADLREDAIWLVPVRGFIGVGWLRAATEKLADPDWLGGASLTTFLLEQRAAGRVVFPLYDAAINDIFLPQAATLSVIILAGQLMTGMGIMLGCLTNIALLSGMLMNLNFLLAGVPNPSAFYLVIQAALLVTHSGARWGADAWLSRWIGIPAVSAQVVARPWRHRRILLLLAALLLGLACVALPYMRDLSPAGSVDDPAVIAAVLATMGSAWCGLAYLRHRPPPDV